MIRGCIPWVKRLCVRLWWTFGGLDFDSRVARNRLFELRRYEDHMIWRLDRQSVNFIRLLIPSSR
jgi:hypothetical protein